MDNKKQTPIEQWIEEAQKTAYGNWQCGDVETNKVHILTEDWPLMIKETCLSLLKELGLQDQPDPKKWVEEMKMIDSVIDIDKFRTYQQLQAENERLKADVRNKLSPISNLIAMIENGLVKGDVEMHELILKEIEQCKMSIKYLTHPDLKGGK